MCNFTFRINYGYGLEEPPDVNDLWEYDDMLGEGEEDAEEC